MWLSAPTGTSPDPTKAIRQAQASAMRALAAYLRTQEDAETSIRLRGADIRVLREPDEIAGVPIYHDCDECRASRIEAELWLRHNTEGALLLVLFEYDELTRG